VATNSIEVERFTKKYGNFHAVDDISFSVEEGSIFAFLGPNGAGKSTTINTLCTIQEKTAGTLRINGNDVTLRKAEVRKDIGIVFQECTLDQKLTVRENLKLHCDFYGVPKAEVKERIRFVLELVDIEEWKDAPVNALSGGLKRRAEIARGLVHYPKVLFLDEPLVGLDPKSARLRFPRDTQAIITDTVGFIRNLPRELFAAFRATLAELQEADLLLHVIDISNPNYEAHITAVESVLRELHIEDKPVIRVFNKQDRFPDRMLLQTLCRRYQATAISALQPERLLHTLDRDGYVVARAMFSPAEVAELIDYDVNELVSAKNGFKSFERIFRFALTAKPFEVGRELSAKQEIKRHAIVEIYHRDVKKLFE